MSRDHFWPIVFDRVERRGDAPALIAADPAGDRITLSWRQLASAAEAVSATLAARIGDDESRRGPTRIVHRCSNRLGDVLIWLACLRGNLIDVPIDGRLPAAALDDLRRQSGGVWIDDETCESFARLSSPPPPLDRQRQTVNGDAPALILWTSGTSDRPKGVVLSHRALVTNAAAKLKAVPQSPDDVRLTVLPICHAYARTCDLGTWLLSGSTLALGSGFEGWRGLGPSVRPTMINVVPSLAKRMLREAVDGDATHRLRVLGCGGAGLDQATFDAWQARGVAVVAGYGLTETGPVIASASSSGATFGNVGRVVDGWQTRLVGERLSVRGPSLMLGYLQGESIDRRGIDSDGWFVTNDSVRIDATTGEVTVLGRTDDVIVLPCGHKVHPAAVQQRLECVPGVQHGLVDSDGQTLTAWLVPDHENASIDMAEIRQVLEALPAYARPTRIHTVWPPPEFDEGCVTIKGTLRRKAFLAGLANRRVDEVCSDPW